MTKNIWINKYTQVNFFHKKNTSSFVQYITKLKIKIGTKMEHIKKIYALTHGIVNSYSQRLMGVLKDKNTEPIEINVPSALINVIFFLFNIIYIF